MNTVTNRIVSLLRALTGRRHPHLEGDLDKLSPEGQRDLLRLLNDLDNERAAAERQARFGPLG